jgi:hypothetical protein
MDSSSIDLPGSEVESIQLDGERLVVRFSRAYIIQTMTGSQQRTRWYQAGELVFRGATVEGDLPQCPCVCVGGDVGENIYTYRDMLPLPLKSSGLASCKLRFEGSDQLLLVEADGVELVMEDRPRYIEHIS